ncbi:DUF885 family protein [Sphingomonas sp.]|uniref:DUF885 family protein n=1 Tax=Sphingomonas sp. TaxID=28214 RepID=UPI00333EC1AF
MSVTRRTVLIGGAVLALAGRAQAAITLSAALDAAAEERDPEKARALLAGFDPRDLPPVAALDLVTARAGLASDIAIRRAGQPGFDVLLERIFGPHRGAAAVERRLIRAQQEATRAALLLFDARGIDGATPGARFVRLWHESDGQFADSDAGRDAAIVAMNKALDRLRAMLPTLIGPVPGYCRDVSATRGSPEEQASGKVGARRLPLPGRPGAYVVDLARIADRPRCSLPSVVAHELLPGHMIQLPIEAAARPHTLRLSYAPGFAEGWGISAERLVARAGAWADDPRAQLGYLHWRLFRIARARADIGLHVHGWSIDEARARLVEWHGEPAYFAPFDSDLARIAREPAARTAEMLFALAIEDGTRGRRGRGRIAYHQALLVDGRMRSDEIARRART